VITELQRGADLGSAARSAGLNRETAERFLDSIKTYLARRDGTRSPARKGLRLTAVSDGASRGNPGEAACGVIITDADGEELLRRGKRLGVATNNTAEYHGVILALELAQALGASELVVKLDSELVVKQLRGEYKVKNASLKPLAERARELIETFDHFDLIHVSREQTKEADKLANAELDGREPA
jgi:ribonuclease HI